MNEHHTFFNVITLPEGKEKDAFEAWKAVGRFMETQEGFLGSMLYRNRKNPRMLINHGRYSSEEAFLTSVRSEEFQALSQRLTDLGVERIAGLYDAVHAFGD
jgi:heme-degrading monooxygenase HmoA